MIGPSLSKKGYVYTLTTVFFLGIFLAVFVADTEIENSNSHALRVSIMDSVLEDLEQDLVQASYIAGVRALIALEEHLAQTGVFIDDLGPAFSEAFTNGSIEYQPYEILDNSTFNEYSQRIRSQLARQGIRLELELLNVSVYHITPWDVAVDFSLQINMSDTPRTTRWNYTYHVTSPIRIYGLRDPLYAVATNNKVTNTIERNILSGDFVNDVGDANDTTKLMEHIRESYYIPSTSGPNFLMRFTGNLTGHRYGIESLVNLDRVSAQGIIVNITNSVVDYLYFTSPGSAVYCNIQNTTSYFKLDADRLATYDIAGKLEYSSC